VIVTPRAGTGGVQTLTPDSMGNFSVPRHLGNGSYRLAVEAEGHLTEYFTLAVTDDRVAVSKDSELPNASSEVIYDVRHQDPRIPAIVYMPIDMYPAPHIKGRIIWPRRDEDGGEFVDIVEGGMVTLMTTKGEKAAFHTVSMVEQGGTAPGGEAGAGGYYDIWLPSRHGTFKLRYTGTHTKMEDIVIAPDQASTIAIEIPKTAHLPESSEIRTFAPGNLPVDIPVQTRYDGSWFITAVPSIPSYTYTYEYEVDGETVTGQETEICESFTVNLTLEGGSGIAYTSDGDESGVSIDIDGKFSGEVWGLSWSGYIWQGGSYAWDGAGDMDVGCYGTYTSQQR
ncbi:MAG: hypothetical protein LPK85_04935, partial [Gammaproteobacteria bacterium]|nr:hypothetical protein [Gammaproteobacteria bacterium]